MLELEFSVSQNRSCKKTFKYANMVIYWIIQWGHCLYWNEDWYFLCKEWYLALYNAKCDYINEYIHKSTSNYFSREIVLKMQSDFVPRNVKNIKFISCV